MTSTFEAIIEQKKAAIIKVREGLQELAGQPSLKFPPDEELRRCTSPELVFLIALDAQVATLDGHAITVLKTIFAALGRTQTLTEILKDLGKLDNPRGGTGPGW